MSSEQVRSENDHRRSEVDPPDGPQTPRGSGNEQWWPGTPKDLTLSSILASSEPRLLAPTDVGPFFGRQAQNSRSSNDFSTCVVDSEADLQAVIALRREAYRKHGRSLQLEIEAEDRLPETGVLAVRDSEGELIGTMRVTFGTAEGSFLAKDVEPPAYLRHQKLAFFERLAIRGGGIRAVRAKQSLFKSAYLLALANNADWVAIWTLSPLNRLFEGLGFVNVFGHREPFSVPWYPEPIFMLALDLRHNSRALLRGNLNWYKHVLAADQATDSALASYFRRRSHHPVAMAPQMDHVTRWIPV